MSDRRTHAEDLTSIEAALAALDPKGPNLDRDAFMFRAGQASMTQVRSPVAGGRLWPVATLALASLSAVLVVQLVRQPSLPIAEYAVPATSPVNAHDDPSVVETDSGDSEIEAPELPTTADIATTTLPRHHIPLTMGPYAGGGSTNYIAMRQWVMVHGADAWWNLSEQRAGNRTQEPRTRRPPPTLLQQRRELQQYFDRDWIEPALGETS